MKARINGTERSVANGTTVAELLDELGLDRRHLAVEHNRELLDDPSAWERVRLAEGDELEIVRFVGGG